MTRHHGYNILFISRYNDARTPRDATISYTTQCFRHIALVLHLIYLLLDEFERREENRIHYTRPAHGNTESSIHSPVEELYFRGFVNFLPFAVCKTVSLIDALGRVDGIYKSPGDYPTQTSSSSYSKWTCCCFIFSICRKELLAAFVCHEIYRGAQSISHCKVSAQCNLWWNIHGY
jgi:hypothetical protein